MHSLEKLYHGAKYGRNQLMTQGLHFCLIILQEKDNRPPLLAMKRGKETTKRMNVAETKFCIIRWVNICTLTVCEYSSLPVIIFKTVAFKKVFK